jgi:hypothetical protein
MITKTPTTDIYSTSPSKRPSFRVYTSGHDSDSDEKLVSPATSPKKSFSVPTTTPSLYASRVILTTYPGQVGIVPLPMAWGHPDPNVRGPVVASRHPSCIKQRNATGAHGGSYSVNKYLSISIFYTRINDCKDLSSFSSSHGSFTSNASS